MGTYTAKECSLAAVLVLALAAVGLPQEPQPQKSEAPVPTSLFHAPQDTAVWPGGHRVPTAVLTNKGTLLAVSEHRLQSGDRGNVDLVCKRSTDGGMTWGDPKKQILIYEEGDDASIGFTDPGVVIDRTTGVIWCLFARNKQSPLYVTSSDDDGLTWKRPKDITDQVKPKELKMSEQYLFGKGPGLQLKSGRMIVPAQHLDSDIAHVVYSDDHGSTWKMGGILPRVGKDGRSKKTEEGHIVELADGSFYMNMRASGKRRLCSWSKDQGMTWSPPEYASGLVDSWTPGDGCDAGLARLTLPGDGIKGRVIFCNPTEPKGNRADLAGHISYDECKTWQKFRLIKSGHAGYSDLVIFPDMTIGCIYETHTGGWNSIRFARFTLEWLTEGKDKIEAGAEAAEAPRSFPWLKPEAKERLRLVPNEKAAEVRPAADETTK